MFSETIELRGHIIDSLILPKVLDEILKGGGNFKIAQVKIGQQRADQSFARIEVSAESGDALDDLILRLRQHGAEVAEKGDAQLAAAPADGIFQTIFMSRQIDRRSCALAARNWKSVRRCWTARS